MVMTQDKIAGTEEPSSVNSIDDVVLTPGIIGGIQTHETSEGVIIERETQDGYQAVADVSILNYIKQLEAEKKELREQNKVLGKQNQVLGKKCLTDVLTGIPNRRDFNKNYRCAQVKAEIDPSYKFTIGRADIDNFKAINDTYGHLEGDRILREVAQVLYNNIRSGSDKIARDGGEEFVVILQGADPKYVPEILENLRKSVMENVFDRDGKPITISIGAASYKRGEDTFEVADRHLYLAKRAGKNVVRHSIGPIPMDTYRVAS